jgi:hypothetical protein
MRDKYVNRLTGHASTLIFQRINRILKDSIRTVVFYKDWIQLGFFKSLSLLINGTKKRKVASMENRGCCCFFVNANQLPVVMKLQRIWVDVMGSDSYSCISITFPILPL